MKHGSNVIVEEAKMRFEIALSVGLGALVGATVAHVGYNPSTNVVRPAKPNGMQIAQNMTCFYTGEETSGFNRICYYDCLGSAAAITISSVEICPLTIQR